MAVFLTEVARYNVAAIEAEIERGIEALELSLEGRRTALLKPNIVMAAAPRTAIVTNPVVVEAVVNVLRRRGFTEIAIADGPGVGLDVDNVFRVSGYRALADRLGVELINFNTAARREREWKYGKLGIPAVLEDADLYVNIPKLKTHGYTTVTLSIKNHKGMLCESDKKLDHHLGLHHPLVEQAKLRPPDLIVLDGIVGIEGDGPLNGKPVCSRLLAMGTNMLELDATAARHAGFDPSKIKHLAIALEEGLGSMDPEVIGDAPVTRFDPANEEFGRVMNIYSWRDCTACSMCIDSFSAGVKLAVHDPRYWFTLVPRLAFWGVFGKLHIVQGREARLPDLPGRVICLGKCTAGLARKEGLLHIPGCPPSARDVADNLRKRL